MAERLFIDLIPQAVDLRLYVGDDTEMQITVFTDETKTEIVNLTPYTEWLAQIRSPAGDIVSFSADTAQAADGLVVLVVEGDLLRALPPKGCRWDLQVTEPPDRQVTLARGRVSLVADISQ